MYKPCVFPFKYHGRVYDRCVHRSLLCALLHSRIGHSNLHPSPFFFVNKLKMRKVGWVEMGADICSLQGPLTLLGLFLRCPNLAWLPRTHQMVRGFCARKCTLRENADIKLFWKLSHCKIRANILNLKVTGCMSVVSVYMCVCVSVCLCFERFC